MLKRLGVLAIFAIVASGCGANRAPAGRPSTNGVAASAAQSDSSAVLYNPCEHPVYRHLAQAVLPRPGKKDQNQNEDQDQDQDQERPFQFDERDRNYLFELDRLCREYSEAAAAKPTPKPPLKHVQEGEVPACTHPVYVSLQDSVETDPHQLTDQDHWYFHELDRACLQGKVAAAEKNVSDAEKLRLRNASNRNPYHWMAFLAGLGLLALNLFWSTS